MGSRLLQAVVIILVSMLLMYIGWPLFDSLAETLMAEDASRFSYTTGADDDSIAIYGSNYAYQTFTTNTTSYDLTTIRLLLYAVGTPGTVTCYLEPVVASEPTNLVLATGSVLGTSISSDSDGTWTTFTMTDYSLSTSTQYSVVLKCSGSSSSYVVWRIDCTSPSYTDGQAGYSEDSGSTWITGGLCGNCEVFTIIATEVAGSGKLSPVGLDTYVIGSNQVYTISDDINHIIVDGVWLVSGTSYSWGTCSYILFGAGTVTFTNISDDHVLTVYYGVPE